MQLIEFAVGVLPVRTHLTHRPSNYLNQTAGYSRYPSKNARGSSLVY